MSQSHYSIKTVNLRDFELGARGRYDFITTVTEAATTTGFICVEGGGLEQNQIAWCYSQAKQVFALGPNVLTKYQTPGNQLGYIPFAVEQAADAVVPDIKEFWQSFRDPRVLWPSEVVGFRFANQWLFKNLEFACERMLQALALGLGHAPKRFSDMTKDGDSLTRCIHYPPLNPGVVGVRSAAHTDINFGTALITSDGEGLEVMAPDGHWIPVNSQPGQFVYNTADMLSALTGGEVKSVVHRVVNPSDPEKQARSRFSWPFFHHPRAEVVLVPEGPQVKDHAPLTAGMFLELRLWEIHLIDQRPTWYTGPDRKPKVMAVKA